MQGILYRSLGVFMVFCSAAFADAAPAKKVLFVVSGGYNSCSKSSQASRRADAVPIVFSYKAMEKTIKTRGVEVMTLFSCLNDDAPPDGEAEYVLSENRGEHFGSTKDIRADIEAILKKNPGTAVYLIGHSYGGYMAMYLAETLAGTPNLQGLFTLDPIGPDCGALGVVFGSDACHSAPTDRDNKAIARRTATWHNFYQVEDSWLSSSEIPEAQNHHITFSWGPHGEMDTEKVVWDQIQKVVLKSL